MFLADFTICQDLNTDRGAFLFFAAVHVQVFDV